MSFSFFLCQYRVNLGSVGVKDARQSRSPCISSLNQPVTKRVDPAVKGKSEACIRQRMSCRPLSKEGSAAPASVSGETLPSCGGAAPCSGESLIGGILRRSPAPARCALWSVLVCASILEAASVCRGRRQRRPRRRSGHLHKTGTEPGHMAGTSAGGAHTMGNNK